MKAPAPSDSGAPSQGGATNGPAEPEPRLSLEAAARLDERSLSRLKWRCRRGLLENDLFIERFFRRHEETITTRQAAGLMTLMDLADNDLLDLLLRRTEPSDDIDGAEVRRVLALLRSPPLEPPRD